MQLFLICPMIKNDKFTGEFFTYRDYCYDGKGGVTAKLRDFRSWYNPRSSRYSQEYYNEFFNNGFVRCLDILRPQNGYRDVSFIDWLNKGPGYRRIADLKKQEK